MYSWALQGLGRWGWVAAFIYCAGAALRLARFNTQLDVADKRYFTGIPSPAAGALVAGLVWVLHDYEVPGRQVSWYGWGVTVFAGVTMVSNIRYYSFKDINLRKAVPFWVLLLIMLVWLFISIDPPKVLFGGFVAYALSGYVMWAIDWIRSRRNPA
jgi:CDP-diacylglycerol---serine O-phosphatidyltransferase